MTNNSENKAVKAGIGYLIGNYLIKGMFFFTLPIFARLLSTADYGLYNTFIATEGLLAIIIGFAIHVCYKNAWYKFEKDDHKQYYEFASCSMLLIILSTLFFSLLFFIFSDFFSQILLLDRISLILLSFYSGSAAIISCFNAHVGIQYEYKKFLSISGINSIVNIGLSILLLYTFYSEERYLGRIIGVVIPSFLVSLYIIGYFFKRTKPLHIKSNLLWGLKYSLPIVPNGIGQVLLSQFDRLMINKIISSSAAGIYSFAYNIFGIVNVTSISLDNAFSPWLYEKMESKDYKSIEVRCSSYSIFMMFFFLIVMFCSPELIYLLGTDDYFESVYTVVPLIAGGYFLFLTSMPICIEYYYEKTGLIAVGTGIAALLNIILNLYFIPIYGYISAAYTTMFTYLIYFVFHIYQSKIVHKSFIFPLKTFIICSLIVMFVLFIVLFFRECFWVRYVLMIIAIIFALYYEEKTFGFIKNFLNK